MGIEKIFRSSSHPKIGNDVFNGYHRLEPGPSSWPFPCRECFAAHGRGYTATWFKILSPLAILKAACRYQQLNRFFAMVVNLARLALSCRWEIPKYCSTMYRTLEIFLFRSISSSVSFAVEEPFRMIPSQIRLRAKKLRLGLPAYPLSAKTFSIGCLV